MIAEKDRLCPWCRAGMELESVWDTQKEELRNSWECLHCDVTWVDKGQGKLGVVIR